MFEAAKEMGMVRGARGRVQASMRQEKKSIELMYTAQNKIWRRGWPAEERLLPSENK